MPISKETMQAIIREYGGFELSDEELDLVQPEVDGYLEAMAGTANLDLSDVMSSRLLRVAEGGGENA
ncbi:MAG: hypothetical protein F4X65_11305 [Chloroflexi bacterium]|nr:hypothetical protein [Chloroflexota bacterium]